MSTHGASTRGVAERARRTPSADTTGAHVMASTYRALNAEYHRNQERRRTESDPNHRAREIEEDLAVMRRGAAEKKSFLEHTGGKFGDKSTDGQRRRAVARDQLKIYNERIHELEAEQKAIRTNGSHSTGGAKATAPATKAASRARSSASSTKSPEERAATRSAAAKKAAATRAANKAAKQQQSPTTTPPTTPQPWTGNPLANPIYTAIARERKTVAVQGKNGDPLTLVPHRSLTPDEVTFSVRTAGGKEVSPPTTMSRFEWENLAMRIIPAPEGSPRYSPPKPPPMSTLDRARYATSWSKTQAEAVKEFVRSAMPYMRAGTIEESGASRDKSASSKHYVVVLRDREKGVTLRAHSWRDLSSYDETRNVMPNGIHG